MQCFTVSVYGSSRPRAVGPGLTIFFDISYLVITQSWTRNEPWLAYFFQQLLCYFALEKKAIQKINYRLKKRKKKCSLRLLETDRTRTKKNVTETILKIFQFLLDWTFWVPKVTNISFLPTILMYHHENTIWEWILKMVTWSPEGKYFQLIFSIDLKFSPLIL